MVSPVCLDRTDSVKILHIESYKLVLIGADSVKKLHCESYTWDTLIFI